MNISIIGSRTFNDYNLVKATVLQHVKHEEIENVVSGGAKGADTLAETFAKEFGISTIIHKPNWSLYGRGAGHIRNKLIIDDSDIVFAFWDGVSKGTLGSIKIAEKQEKVLIITKF